ncbi:hypothetical protein [Sinomonas albida]|uniref:hypothetical protein n=1 Tax=Sinomonas albida TaxID=369942 RepID=UPI0010A877C6|nr:hypothetical protein [Sinomonas albida]
MIPGKMLLRAKWGGRGESLESIVDRIWELLGYLESLGGRIGQPMWSAEPVLVTGDRVELEKIVLARYEKDDATGQPIWAAGTHVSLLQEPYSTERPAAVDLTSTLGAEAGIQGLAVNSALVTFGGLGPQRNEERFPIEAEVLPRAVELVKKFVRVWEPDAASLDCTDLLRAQKVQGITYPTIGFVTWLADNVVAGDLSRVQVAHLERFANGTLLSVDLTGDRLLEDGLALVDQVFKAGLMRPIPAMQGE